MALESLSGPLNMKRLALDDVETRNGLPFNPKRDITLLDWEGMETCWKNRTQLRTGELRFLASMIVLGKDPVLDPKTLAELEQHLEEALDDYFCTTNASYTALMGKTVPMDDGRWAVARKLLASSRKNPTPQLLLLAAHELALLGDTVSLRDDEWELLQEFAEKIRMTQANFLEVWAGMKIHGRPVPAFSGSEWNLLRKELHRLGGEQEWKKFADRACHLAILASKNVRVTANGLVLTAPANTSAIPKFPVLPAYAHTLPL